MSGARVSTVIGVVAVALVVATPAWAQKGKGGGKPGGSNTVFVRQVTIDDGVSAQLKSDGKVRLPEGTLCDPADETGPCHGDLGSPVIYQDHRLSFMDEETSMPMSPYPDPCVGSNDNQFDLDRGYDPYQTNCNVAPGSEGDGRTFTLVFLPADPNNVSDPVHDVCDQFRFLVETNPAAGWGTDYEDEAWGTTFEWDDPDDHAQGCRVTPSPAGIVTDPDSTQLTANAQFYGDPFAEPKKGKKGGDGSTMSLNINFRVDRPYPGEANQWQVKSLQDLEITMDENDADVRTVTATDQLFELCRGSTCFGDFQFPLQIVYRRHEVIVQ